MITSRGGGLYSIWNYDSGLSLDVWGNSKDVGANMQTFWRNNAYDGEKFYILKAADGSVIIRPKCTKCVVEADGHHDFMFFRDSLASDQFSGLLGDLVALEAHAAPLLRSEFTQQCAFAHAVFCRKEEGISLCVDLHGDHFITI